MNNKDNKDNKDNIYAYANRVIRGLLDPRVQSSGFDPAIVDSDHLGFTGAEVEEALRAAGYRMERVTEDLTVWQVVAQWLGLRVNLDVTCWVYPESNDPNEVVEGDVGNIKALIQACIADGEIIPQYLVQQYREKVKADAEANTSDVINAWLRAKSWKIAADGAIHVSPAEVEWLQDCFHIHSVVDYLKAKGYEVTKIEEDAGNGWRLCEFQIRKA